MTSRAAAAPVELLDALHIAPSDPDTLLLSYRNGGGGLLVSRDGGQTFRLLCNSGIDPKIRREVSAVTVTGEGSILLGLFDGMWRADQDACGFAREEALQGQWVNDFAVDPRDPTRTFAITSAGGKPNGIFSNDGKSSAWTEVGGQEEILINRLRVAKNGADGVRIYESAVRGEYELPVADGGMPDTLPRYVIRYTDDLGKTWTEHEFGMTEGTVRLLAIDPTDHQRIVVAVLDDRLDGTVSKPDEVLWSASAGAPGSFEKVGEVIDLGGFDMAPDGRLFYGDREQTRPGLYSAAKLGETPKLLSDESKVQCVRYDAQTDKLYVCHDRVLGTVDAKTGAFTELFDFTKTEQFVSCEGEPETAGRCETQLVTYWCGYTHYPMTPICMGYDVPDVVWGAADGGMPGGDADAGVEPDAGEPGPSGKKGDDGGCSVGDAGGHGGGLAGWLGLLALGAASVRRRRPVG